MAKHRPHLKSIDLTQLKSFSDEGLAALAVGCLSLPPHKYHFNDTKPVKFKVDHWFKAVAKHHQDMTALEFLYSEPTERYNRSTQIWEKVRSELWTFNPSSLAALVRGCPGMPIESFKYGGGDEFCAAVAERHDRHSITKINLEKHTKVTSKGLVALIKGCTNLHPDNIVGIPQTVRNDQFLCAVAKYRPNITKLDLLTEERYDHGKFPYGDKGLVALIKGCPNFTPTFGSKNWQNWDVYKTEKEWKPKCHNNVGDAYCIALTKHRPHLREIDIRSERVTTKGNSNPDPDPIPDPNPDPNNQRPRRAHQCWRGPASDKGVYCYQKSHLLCCGG